MFLVSRVLKQLDMGNWEQVDGGVVFVRAPIKGNLNTQMADFHNFGRRFLTLPPWEQFIIFFTPMKVR